MIVIDKYAAELEQVMREFGAQAGGKTEKEILELQRAENAALMECLKRHKRELDWLAGEKIEPVVHQAEAVLVGIGAGALG